MLKSEKRTHCCEFPSVTFKSNMPVVSSFLSYIVENVFYLEKVSVPRTSLVVFSIINRQLCSAWQTLVQ